MEPGAENVREETGKERKKWKEWALEQKSKEVAPWLIDKRKKQKQDVKQTKKSIETFISNASRTE